MNGYDSPEARREREIWALQARLIQTTSERKRKMYREMLRRLGVNA